MKVALINTGDIGSTGKICISICNYLLDQHDESLLLVKKKITTNAFIDECYSGKINDFCNKCFSKIGGKDCFLNHSNTKKIIEQINIFKPDLVHLHNFHGSFLNIRELIQHLVNNHIPIVWTLHDCWSFTGRCACYDFNSCYKWENGCGGCKYKGEYPKSLIFDNSKKLYFLKKELFTGKNITFVTPSCWLANETKRSFLKDERLFVINNGVKSPSKVTDEDIKAKRDQLGIEQDKKIVFSAAFSWSEQKGLTYIEKAALQLAERNIVFVIAGIGDKIVRNRNIIFVPKITNRQEMNIFFSMSDVFLNPTLQDTFPTVNIESLMNGTPVITFNTGGSPEIIDKGTGVVVEKGNLNGLVNAITQIEKTEDVKNKCIKRSQLYNEEEMAKKYHQLYKETLKLSVVEKLP